MDYYSDNDPFACEWMRNLIAAEVIPEGTVDGRSIADLRGADLQGCRRVHLFAGVAGWAHALQLAGWPVDRSVWTGSCPCQSYSAAGKQKGDADARNLWPEMLRLIRECRPDTILGEQVEAAIGHGWLDGISADLEAEGYAIGTAVLGAHSAGAPHLRQRLFWVADADRAGKRPGRGRLRDQRDNARGRGATGRLDNAGSERTGSRHTGQAEPGGDRADNGVSGEAGCGAGGLGDTDYRSSSQQDAQGQEGWRPAESESNGPWDNALLIPCRDGKVRRISAEPELFCLAHGVPSRRDDPRLGYLLARLAELGYSAKAARRLVRDASRNRVSRLRGYGNAIVPHVAVLFIRAFLEATP